MKDLDGARWTIQRIVETQSKMSQCMDECLAEISALFPNLEQPPLKPTNNYDNPDAQNQADLPRMMQSQKDMHYDH